MEVGWGWGCPVVSLEPLGGGWVGLGVSGSIPGTAGWRLGGGWGWGSPVVSLEPLGGGWVGLGVSGSIPGTAGWRLGGVGGLR